MCNFKKSTYCSICLEKINKLEKYKTKCNHLYHIKCINKWLKINNTCPICRTELYKKNLIFDIRNELYERINIMERTIIFDQETPILIFEPIID